jgi:hypothetical protein
VQRSIAARRAAEAAASARAGALVAAAVAGWRGKATRLRCCRGAAFEALAAFGEPLFGGAAVRKRGEPPRRPLRWL